VANGALRFWVTRTSSEMPGFWARKSALRFVAGLAPASAITFSFYLPDELLAGEDLELTRQLARNGADKSEPWLSRHRPQELHAIASSLGFSSTFHLTPETASKRYFSGRKDGLRAPRAMQLFTAKT
jgi:O-methyltransferase involved in polyketide biosynthesis